jgi:hypothetical protein
MKSSTFEKMLTPGIAEVDDVGERLMGLKGENP